MWGAGKEDAMRRKKTAAAAALLGAIAEAEAKTTAQGEEDLNALKDLLKQFLQIGRAHV